MKYGFNNKKGQVESIILVVILIFIIGIILVFGNYVNDTVYTKFDSYFDDSPKYNNSDAHQAINEIQTAENSLWDYAFLAIFVGYLIQMIFLSFGSKINIAFFWIYSIFGLVGLIIGTMLSNVWQELAADPTLATIMTHFPITNLLLGTYYPMVITGILLIVIIVTFGKPPGLQQ